MSQNQLTARHIESLAPFTGSKESLRDETERTLCDIAYVLQLTGRVKKSILEEKSLVAAK